MRPRNAFALAGLVIFPLVLIVLTGLAPLPLKISAAILQAQQAEAQGRPASAAANLRVLESYHPVDSSLWERIGNQELIAQNYQGAIQAFNSALQQGTLSVNGLYELGTAYQRSGDINSALSAWRSILDQPGVNLELYPELLDIFEQYNAWDAATQTAQLWHDADHYNSKAGLILGELLSYQDPAAAVDILTTASIPDNQYTTAAGKLIQAIQAGQAQNDQAYLYTVVGQSLGDIDAWLIAVQAFTRATQINPNYAEAWALLSEAQQNLGQDGYPALQRAFSLDPNSDIVKVTMALYYRRLGKPERALIFLRALANKYPAQGKWQIEIGAALAEEGNLIEAMRAYEQAVVAEPDNADNWRALALFSANNGFDAQSYTLPAASKALELDPNSVETLDMAGWINLTLGNLDKAEQFLQQALKKDAAYPPALLHLAQLYIKKNTIDQAYASLKQASQQTRDEAVALQAQRLLEKYFPDK